MNLTKMEIKILNAMRSNDYDDVLESGSSWVFGVIDASGILAAQARGVIASLVKKGLVTVYKCDKDEIIGYTDEGRKLFETADGKENTGWGGARLLKEVTLMNTVKSYLKFKSK